MVLTCDPLGFPLLRRRCSLPAGILLGSLEVSRLAGDRMRTFSQTSRPSACEVTVSWQSPSLIFVPSAAVLLSAPLRGGSPPGALVLAAMLPWRAKPGGRGRAGSCELGFPSSPPPFHPAFPGAAPLETACGSRLARLLPANLVSCCSTLEALLCSSRLSLSALLEMTLWQQMSISLSIVMADSGLASEGDVVSREIFCCCGEAETEK